MLKHLLKFSLVLLLVMPMTFANASDSLFYKCSKVLREQIIASANHDMNEAPMTITSMPSTRSAGGKHDYFSEGDYWWPDTTNLQGPYIQKDGLTNPNNFIEHRTALVKFSQIIGNLASAYALSKNKKYANQAIKHLKAWLVDTSTLMNPSLLYAQAIKGRFTGRGVGIIDMIQMVDVVKGIEIFEKNKIIDPVLLAQIKNWFTQYLQWVTTYPYGIDERDAKNNHATCWVMQVAVFASFTQNTFLIDYCKNSYKTILLVNQVAQDGSFPLELKRTKPYGYSLFNLDAMATICYTLSTKKDNLWEYTLADGRNIKKAYTYLMPYVTNKNNWPFSKDVMYWNEWPVAQPFLIFGSRGIKDPALYDVWEKLPHFPTVNEVNRNVPIRHLLIWL